MSRVVFLSGDLMFASRVRAAAEAAELDFQLAMELPDDAADVSCVILDLSTRSKLTPVIAEHCAQRCPDAKLIAYGPHVQVPKLNAARESGIPVVLTRGQFDRELTSLFG